MSRVVIERAGESFDDWRLLLRLLHAAFAYQKDRIDPPSSLYRLDERSLAAKAADEQLILAKTDGELAGCVFARRKQGAMYLGKLAVRPERQGAGIGRLLVEAVEMLAIEQGCRHLELETRIELVENHETFARMGFDKVSEGAHDGYEHPTFITMRKRPGRR